jgi:protein-S-isoprenylcysteine O-methyltransferase Ste14
LTSYEQLLSIWLVPGLALAFLLFYGVLAFGVRMAVQRRRTGSTGFKGLRHTSGTAGRVGGGLLALAAVLLLAGPVLQLAAALTPVEALDGRVADVLGVTIAFVGVVLTVVAQFAMGDDWRIGVDTSERTCLVTHGPFSVVRNPIYAAMIPSFVGVALIAPNDLTIAGALLAIVALELQTRLVEEPYLLRVHGAQYATYAHRVGRFIPGVGRLRVAGARDRERDRRWPASR